jgi:hypothetical protein
LRRIIKISEEQFGFMNGKSTTDAIFALRQIQEKYQEGRGDLHSVYNIDLEKAYERVPRKVGESGVVWNIGSHLQTTGRVAPSIGVRMHHADHHLPGKVQGDGMKFADFI